MERAAVVEVITVNKYLRVPFDESLLFIYPIKSHYYEQIARARARVRVRGQMFITLEWSRD